ncbi:phosphotransferase [Ilumatobacter sp.]|uniref:phosphotransferase n=1 Tax=Ilumatobacter sp. TaxID=1967498 RepID=UPI003AF97D03
MTTADFDALELVARRGPSWFGDLADGRVTAELLSSSERAGIGVQMVELRGRDTCHQIVVKRYHSRRSIPLVQRPRLGDPDDARVKPECEFAALVELDHALRPAATGVAAVRPLEFLDEYQAIVMERYPGTDARPYLRRQTDHGLDVLGSGGAALAIAHRVLERPDRIRLASPGEIDGSFRSFCEHLMPLVDARLIDHTRRWWSSAMPDDAPALGACHGDCAPRNLLVDADANAAWIDGLFRWRAPVYQDIAVFVTSARVRARLTPGSRRNRFAAWRTEAFVDGYRRHVDVQPEWLTRFEVLVLLDRLASLVEHGSSVRQRLVRRAVEAELAALVETRA